MAVSERADAEIRAMRHAALEEDGGDDEIQIVDRTTLATQVISPEEESPTSAVSSDRRGKRDRDSSTYRIKPKFSAPYLKGGLTHFQKKLKASVEKQIKDGALDQSPEKVSKNAVTVRYRRTSYQKNCEWRNENSQSKDVNERYKNALKEATKSIADHRAGRIPNPPPGAGGQQYFVDQANKKYNLDGEGKENSREQKRIALSTVLRYIEKGRVGKSPAKKGRQQSISRNLLRLVALHANMEQVGPRGEMDSNEIKAMMQASTLDTALDGTYNLEYAWEQCRKENAEILIPTGAVQSEDIRWKWVTWEKLNQSFCDMKVSY